MPPENDLTENEVTDLLNYDPFSTPPDEPPTPPAGESPPPTAEKEAAGEPAATAGAPAASAAAGETPVAPTSSAPTDVGSGGTVEVGILQRLVESQAKQIETLTRSLGDFEKRPTAAPAAAAPAGENAPSPAGLPSYDYDIPDELVDAMSSDDARTRKLALRALVKGTATAIHQEMMRSLEPRLSELPKAIESSVSRRQAEDARRGEILRDFYTRFPDLSREELSPLVANVAQRVMAETGISQWNETLRDAVGNRTRQILGIGTPAPVAASVRPAVPAPPPAMHGSNTRPPAAPSGRNVDEVWDLVMNR